MALSKVMFYLLQGGCKLPQQLEPNSLDPHPQSLNKPNSRRVCAYQLVGP